MRRVNCEHGEDRERAAEKHDLAERKLGAGGADERAASMSTETSLIAMA
jgi:hypothetical protein